MKKKNKLVKRIVALGLVAVIVAVAYVFIFGRNNDKVTKIVLDEIPIISYFGITGETTTEADIIVVERDLNNTIMTNGYAVKLFLAPEDRYDHMIETAKQVIEAFKENPKTSYTFDYATSTFAVVEDVESTPIRYDQDVVMAKLEAGENIYPNTLSLDVMLYTDFDEYYLDASAGWLVDLDAALTNAEGEMISLNKSIPAVFLNAVKVGESEAAASVYGIPTVRAVGEYEFLVFDQKLLDYYSELLISSDEDGKEFGFSKNQMLYLSELEQYLRYVKNNEGPEGAEIVPLLNTPSTFTIDADYMMEMLEGNSLAADSNGYIMTPYSDITKFTPHYVTITKYRSLGFISDIYMDEPEDSAEKKEWLADKLINEDYAVAYYTGTKDEIEAIIEEAAGEDGSGKELVYNVYSKPIATSQEICNSVFSIHGANGYGNSDYEAYAINFLRLLNGVNGEIDIKNLLLYGANGVNYTLNNNGEVILPTTMEGEEGQTYAMDNLYTGHTFHAFPSEDKGISTESIDSQKEHNKALQESLLSGFSLAVRAYSVKNYAGEMVSIEGVDYQQVLNEVVDEFYSEYMNGLMFSVPATDEEYIKENEEKIKQTIRTSLINAYTELLIEEKTAAEKADVMADADFIASKKATAETIAKETFIDETRKAMIAEYQAKQEAAGTTVDTTWTPAEEDVTAAVDSFKYLSEDYLADLVQAQIDTFIKMEVDGRVSGYQDTPEFAAKMSAYTDRPEFEAEIEDTYVKKGDEYLAKFIEQAISAQIEEFAMVEFFAMVEEAFAEANSLRIAEIAREYPFVDVSGLSFCFSYNDAKMLFENQYYGLKGEPA